MGYDKLIYLMHDDPRAMHELMDKVTETLILWVKKQKEVIGEPLNECIADQQVYTGEHAGVWFSDDDAVLMSTKTYREFVAPYNSRILKAFGGGCVHYCGNATHHADTFLAMEGLKALRSTTCTTSARSPSCRRSYRIASRYSFAISPPWTMKRISMRCSPPCPIEDSSFARSIHRSSGC